MSALLSPTNAVSPDKRRAIVIGGSVAGLLAARVLADHYDQVLLLDRDHFPAQPAHRAGVPQSHHAHALLPRGQAIISEFFPGIMDTLRANGATVDRNVVPAVFVTAAGKLPTRRDPNEFLAFSRFFLEWTIRERLLALPNVEVRSTCEALGLVATADRARIAGVRVRSRSDEREETLAAALVMDASGRHSKAPTWLAELGYGETPEETISSNIGYASRFYRKPANFPADWQSLIINGRPPHNPRAGLIMPIEDGGWHVTIGGFAGHFPPTDEQGFLQWARELPDPSLYEAIRVAEPLTPIRGYRTPENRLRHFERLPRWPAGLIATGDSVCAFNPIYGQGMTVSAMDALVLQECLQQQRQAPRPNWERRFQQQLARSVAAPWLIASGEDLRWQGVTLKGARPRVAQGLLHRYMDLVLKQAVTDPAVAGAYLAVISMFAPPQALMQPALIGRVLGGALRRAIGAEKPLPSAGRYALTPAALDDLRARPALAHT